MNVFFYKWLKKNFIVPESIVQMGYNIVEGTPLLARAWPLLSFGWYHSLH